jgi:hypothetical protein
LSKQPLIAKFCPTCGKPLESQVCSNTVCRNFGVKINLSLGQSELVLASDDAPFVINNRQLALLVNVMTKDAPTEFWRKLEKTSFRQLVYLAEASANLSGIERTMQSIPLRAAQKEKALTNLNRMAAILEAKADFACLMSQKASAVIQADLNLQAAQDKLQSDQRVYQAIKDQEMKTP